MTVMVADVDLFKNVNDRFGHVTADDVLRAIGQRLTGCVRASATVARLGGDEFGVILPGAKPEVAVQVARRIVTSADFAMYAARIAAATGTTSQTRHRTR